MSNFDFAVTIARIVCTTVGLIVILMWLAGALGFADFRLVFVVPEATAPANLLPALVTALGGEGGAA